jgi:hypothetical protein
MQRELLCLGKMPSLQPPWFHKQNPDLPSFINETQTSLVSPSFKYIKPGPGCQGHVTLFLTFHKQNTFRLMFLFSRQREPLRVPSKPQWETWCTCPCQDPAKLHGPRFLQLMAPNRLIFPHML